MSRDLAVQNHYPAIDILHSISRTIEDVTTSEHRGCASRLKEALATYKKAEDLINIGAYVKGSNPQIDHSIEMIDRINEYLKQDTKERVSLEESIGQIEELFQ